MSVVKRKQSDGSWKQLGEAPLTTPVEDITYTPALPSTITAGNYIIAASQARAFSSNTSSLQPTDCYVTIPKAGTYRFKFGLGQDWGGSPQICLYHGTTAIGTVHSLTSSSSGNAEQYSEDIAIPEDNYEVRLWFKAISSYGYQMGASAGLQACISWPALEEILNARS